MFTIYDTEISRLVKDPNQYRMIRYLHKFEYLKQLTIEKQDDVYVIHAIIHPYYVAYYEDHEVNLTVRNHLVTSYGCSCNKVSAYSACTDIGITIHFINELEIDHIPYNYKEEKEAREKRLREEMDQRIKAYRKSSDLLQSEFYLNKVKDKVQNALIIKDDHTNVKCEVSLVYDDFPCLSFKVGEGKSYVVKNIFSMLDAIARHEYVSYSKTFGFTHQMDHFDEESQKIIEMLQKIRPSYQKLNEKYYSINKRYLPFIEETADIIFDGLMNIDEDHNHISIIEDDNKVKISTILDEEKNLEIVLLSDQLLCGNEYVYIADYENNYIKRYNNLPNETLSSFVNQLQRSDRLLVSNKNLSDFYKYIIDPIKDNIQCEGYQFDEFEQYEIERVLSGDIDENGQISFTYDLEYENGYKASIFDQFASKSLLAEQIDKLCESYASAIDKTKGCYLFDDNKDKTYTFVKQIIPEIQKNAIVFVSDALKQYSSIRHYNITVGVSVSNDLLNVELTSADIPLDELADVLKDYHRRKKFHRLKNGQLIQLKSDELAQADELLDDIHVNASDIQDGKVSLNLFRALSMDESLKEKSLLNINRSDSFKDILWRIQHTDKNDLVIQEPMNTLLRDYQKEGVRWMDHMEQFGFSGILADDMGLGKTLQVITLIKEKKVKPNLVICPASLILNWQEEMHKFAPDMTCLPIYGNQEVRADLIKTINNYDITVTSYDYIRRDIELYHGIELKTLILDEAQYIKNQKTKNAQCVKQLNSQHRFALTGTPIENNLAELWSIFDFLMPDYLYNYHYFTNHFEKDIIRNQDETKQQRLKQMIEPFILRRTKAQVLTELPEKVESNLTFEFNDEEKKLYYANLASASKELQIQLKAENVDKIAILALLTRLRQLCIEPRLVYDNITLPGTKLNGCMELIERLKENHQNCLLFSSFTSMLDLIEEECQKRHISYLKLTGSVDKNKRKEMVDQFQEGKTDVFLISLKAGGTGLNLVAASAVIHYDPWWNQSAENQATDRAYRIGQKNMVQVFKLIMKDSIEEKISILQSKKKELSDIFIEGNEGSIAKLTNEELMALFK